MFVEIYESRHYYSFNVIRTLKDQFYNNANLSKNYWCTLVFVCLLVKVKLVSTYSNAARKE